MPLIRLEIFINAPKETVFDLARSIDLHQISTAHTNERAIAGKTYGLIELGEWVTWEAKHFGVVQKLTSKITAMTAPDYFVDEMVSGAFKSFMHEHIFEAKGEGTLMVDVFSYVSPLGLLGKLADVLFLKEYMASLLAQRNKIVKEFAEQQHKPLFGLESIMFRLKNRPSHLRIKLNDPATRADIDYIERILNRKLPSDFVDFYMLAEGFEADEDMFRLVPIGEMVDKERCLPPNEIYIAEYMIYADSWRVVFDDDNVESYKIVNTNHFNKEVVLTNSLFEFIYRYLNGEGVYGGNSLHSWSEEKLREL